VCIRGNWLCVLEYGGIKIVTHRPENGLNQKDKCVMGWNLKIKLQSTPVCTLNNNISIQCLGSKELKVIIGDIKDVS
jgi:hypothetical protein